MTLVSAHSYMLAQAKIRLDAARARGDRLSAALIEAAMNDLLDRTDVTDVTRNPKAPKEGIHDRGKARR